ncbi:hypothetical protein [Pseudomarimonas salicorniae]|uniref:4-amino-4-deoxy-L-arabinose transferase n=1 Tax=Pseudomarimonas salicorniae TaxID=2933270 RepID=A0ABT0GH45_9GAMM|nr:hypothetical protein [Lysobacter sp. CAU 1642]MCK7593869.1 hypothetical protein [Lysobacter sp. CAU 1642]
MHEVTEGGRARPRRGASLGAGVLAMLVALALGLSTLAHIASYGFAEIYSDQFRQYRNIQQAGMPAALFQPDNGHRQVLPNLVRWMDVEFGQADQRIPLSVGLLMIIAVWGLLLSLAWRERRNSPALAGAVALIATVGLFWAGSARVQYHGNEAVQVHLVILLMLWATRSISALGDTPWRGWAVGLGCAVLAMLSFATGVAVFAGLLGLAVVLRRPWKEVLVAGAISAACLLTYTFVLPGGDGVRNTISLQPLALAEVAATWIGAFPTTSWLALPVEGAFGAGPERVAATGLVGFVLQLSAQALRGLFGWQSQLAAAPVAGVLGFALLAGFCARCWRAPERAGQLERCALGIALFAAALSALVAVGRLEYFKVHPEQMLADRFALYSALFWFALLLCAVARWGEGRWPWLGVAVALGAAVWILPTQELGRGWASHSARVMEARAAQAQSGVLLDGWAGFADMPDLDAVEASLDYYRQAELGMFRTPRSRAMGRQLAAAQLGEADRLPAQGVRLLAANPVDSPVGPAWHLQGVLETRIGADDGVWAVDAQGAVIGVGELGPGPLQRFGFQDRSDWLQFDLYLRGSWQPCSGVRLFLVDAEGRELRPLRPVDC